MSANNEWAIITNGITVRQTNATEPQIVPWGGMTTSDMLFKRRPLTEPVTEDALLARINEPFMRMIETLTNNPQYKLISPNQHIMLLAGALTPDPVVHGIGIQIEIDASNDVVAQRLETLLAGVKGCAEPTPEQRVQFQVTSGYIANPRSIVLKVNWFVE